jgi:hypothetical protein
MKKLIAITALACLASPALAMGTKPSAAPTASRELETLRGLNSEVVMAMQASRSTEAERAAAMPFYTPLQRAVEAAVQAENPRNQAEFDRQATSVRDLHSKACVVLSGC